MHGYFFLLLAALFLSACSDTSRSDTPTESKVIVEPLDSSQLKVTDSVEPEIPPPPEDVYASYRQAFSHYYHREGWASCPPWLGGIANIDVNHFTVYIVGDLEAGRDSLEKRLQRSDFQVKLARFSFGHLMLTLDSIGYFFHVRKDGASVRKETGYYGAGLDERKNRINVTLKYCDESHIAKFREVVSDDSCILFWQHVEVTEVIAE